MGRESRRGAALLTALLIVSVAVTVTIGMISAQHLDIRASGNILERDRGLHLALGGEAWAMGILSRDAVESEHDHLNEIWAASPPPIPVTGGTASGRITDLQGRFNLNNLVHEGKQNPVERARFERLLRVMGLDGRLALAVVDWIDADSQVSQPGGAEDETYLGRRPPYRAANQPFVTPTELRLVEGFNEEAVSRLLPLVTALPERTELNVNTAPVELLMTLVDNMTRSEAMILDDKRQRGEGFKELATLLAEPLFKGREVLSGGLTVSSRFFLVEGEVRQGRGRTRLSSLLVRQNGRVIVRRRAQGVL
ncbi:MAG: type II secretion system minor pseudopilin GspK [Magnetococcales bacterium]|nr:type II secretion system minor pseudopilin GspK [Magnetococcales bacterium]